MSSQPFVAALREDDTQAFKSLYQKAFPMIRNYVRKNSGTLQDAEDVFQEAMTVLLQKLADPGFVLTVEVSAYLFAVSRKIWLKRLRDQRQSRFVEIHSDHDVVEETPSGNTHPEGLVNSLLQRVTDHCKHLLIAVFIKGEPIEKLMVRLGWKNKHTAANQKYKCLEQAKQRSADLVS
jgi:RNA polymerase sigma factor (sigma-70 family)